MKHLAPLLIALTLFRQGFVMDRTVYYMDESRMYIPPHYAGAMAEYCLLWEIGYQWGRCRAKEPCLWIFQLPSCPVPPTAWTKGKKAVDDGYWAGAADYLEGGAE